MKAVLKTVVPIACVLLFTGCPTQGVVCGEGMSACGEVCVDLQSSPQSCGACGVSCGDGQICQEGACACAPGAALCDGACVVTATNPDHCGACGNACGESEVCDDGLCKVSCSAPTTQCGQSCVALDSDAANCGACFNACEQGQSCNGGKCGWDFVAACFTNGQVVGLQAGTFVKGEVKPLGTGPQSLAAHGDVVFSVDGIDSKLYQASASTLDKLSSEAGIGQFANHVLVDGNHTFVVNSGAGTLQILRASGEADPAAGVALETVGEFPFGDNAFPQVAAKVGDKVYVTLLGGFGAEEALPGQKVVELDVSNPAMPTKGREFDLTGLELRAFSAETQNFPRPQGIAAKGDVLYVALNNSDAFYGLAGPGYVAVIPLGDGEMKAIELPEDKCLNATWIAAQGDQIVVGCAGRAAYDPNTFQLLSVDATGVALIEQDQVAGAVSFKCADGDSTCAPPMVGRFSIKGDDILVGDQNAGRIFVVGIAPGTLTEKRGPLDGTALNVCPVGPAGFSNVADILALP